MITITITRRSEDEIESIEIKGHANSGTYGNDLVCAAVSAIVTGGANALYGDKEDSNFEVKLQEGHALIKHKLTCSYLDEDKVKMNMIVTMLKTVEESNPKFVKIVEKNQK